MASIMDALTSLKTTGGFTYSILTGELNPKEGFMVSRDKDKEVIVTNITRYKETSVAMEVKKFISQNIIELQMADVFVGGWIHEGSLYLDLTENFSSRKAAEKTCERYGQLAYFDCALGETIFLNK